jgi:hypothetical protein
MVWPSSSVVSMTSQSHMFPVIRQSAPV